MRIEIAIGARFGKLVVQAVGEQERGSRNTRWRCLCDCGEEITRRGDALRSGAAQSCGCAGIRHQYAWPPAKVAMLRDLVARDLSTHQIIAVLTQRFREPVTRNSVIGRAARLGLRIKRGKPSSQPIMGQPERVSGPQPQGIQRPAVTLPVSEQTGTSEPIFTRGGWQKHEPTRLLDLNHGECRWAVATSPEGSHLFCAGPIAERVRFGAPYCAKHAKMSVGHGRQSSGGSLPMAFRFDRLGAQVRSVDKE